MYISKLINIPLSKCHYHAAHTCNSSIHEAEAGGLLRVQGSQVYSMV